MTEGGRLAGRVAVLTAAGSGIGRATALRLASEGARLVVNDIAPERAEETAELVTAAGGRRGRTRRRHRVGVRRRARRVRRRRLRRAGRVHSNAGFAMAQGSILDITDEGWQADMQLNLAAMFYCIRAAARAMSTPGGGSIVCTSSASGLGPLPGIAGYGSTKAAILQLVQYAAMEFGPANIRVNAVIPGAVKTPAFMGYIGSEERLRRTAADPDRAGLPPRGHRQCGALPRERRGGLRHGHERVGGRRGDGRPGRTARGLTNGASQMVGVRYVVRDRARARRPAGAAR